MADRREWTRREFVRAATGIGAALAWPPRGARLAPLSRTERRDLFPEGVASGDPYPDSVVLWTRRPPVAGSPRARRLTVEVSDGPDFGRIVARGAGRLGPDADWTCRILAGGLEPAREYWYRFTDEHGLGSRVGRTLTAPAADDRRAVSFAFVSCQDVTQGAQNAYRRMIYEDERAEAEDRLAFVLHLGDFVYELVWYPEDRPQGMYDRRLRDVVRYPHGQPIRDFHIPTDVDDYRRLYQGYLHDPDLQDARARWPFVPMWDNHEFSWRGWQSLQNFGQGNVPAQTRKVAANQAWFEYQPARVAHRGGSLLEFGPPQVTDAPIERYDAFGLGLEPNNLAAIASLTAYRALRFGRHLDLIITDQHSYRSEDPMSRPGADQLSSPDFPDMVPQEAMEIIDAGRAGNGGSPVETIRLGGQELPNFQRTLPPQSILGERQKAWFLDRLRRSGATWKVWGNSQGTLDWRTDPQRLPAGLTKPWPGAGYATSDGGDYATAYTERAEIYDAIARERIGGFASVSGDRHSFWAGLAAKALPPAAFEPVGVAFITGSISAPGLVEVYEHRMPKAHPLRPLYLVDRPGGGKPEATINLLLVHGVRSCLEYGQSRDLAAARALSNRDNAPHLSFVDMGGHGYATVRVSGDAIESHFVCLPRPIERSEREDGGPLRYRMAHRARLWRPGERPVLEQRLLEGDAGLGVR
jgi:alkaline phosphatase D